MPLREKSGRLSGFSSKSAVFTVLFSTAVRAQEGGFANRFRHPDREIEKRSVILYIF